MYTANIISVEALGDGRSRIEVQFTNGTITTPSEFVIPQDTNGLDYFIKGRLDSLNYVVPAVGPYVPPVIPTPPVPTQAELDLASFSRQLQLLIALKAAKDLNIITGTEPVVVTAINNIKALAVVNIPKLFL